MDNTRQILAEALRLVTLGWCRDALAIDRAGDKSNCDGNLVIKYNEAGEEISREFREAVSWSLTGALQKAADCPVFPNSDFGAAIKVLEAPLAKRGYRYMADFNDYQVIVKKKVVAQTTQADIIKVLTEALSSL